MQAGTCNRGNATKLAMSVPVAQLLKIGTTPSTKEAAAHTRNDIRSMTKTKVAPIVNIIPMKYAQ